MSKTIISSKQVKELRQDGIVYIDNDGNEQFIDFEACYQNYLRPRLSPEGFKRHKEFNPQMDDLEAYTTRVKAWKQVALRNVLGDGLLELQAQKNLPYFEFHTKPPVCIECESRDDYYDMRHKIEQEFRWHTFDMT